MKGRRHSRLENLLKQDANIDIKSINEHKKIKMYIRILLGTQNIFKNTINKEYCRHKVNIGAI